jgi:hypothetical protein
MSQKIKNLWTEGFIPKTHHPKSQTVHWSGPDTLENWRKNPKPEYTETSITYSYNSYGYRTKEFNFKNNMDKILCLGCSHAEGVGLKQEDIWVSHITANFPNSDVYNLGVGGASPDYIARVLTNTVSVFNPTHIFIIWPDASRFETCKTVLNLEDDPTLMNGPWNLHEHNKCAADETHMYNNLQKNKLIVKLLQDKYQFELYELSNDIELGTMEFNQLYQINQARDNHYGPAQHQRIAELFMEKVNANTTL